MVTLDLVTEQEGIVQRVEQLLGLCDALEARLRSALMPNILNKVFEGEL